MTTSEIHNMSEGDYTLNGLADLGIQKHSLKAIEKSLALPASKWDEKIYFVGIIDVENKILISYPKSLNIDLVTNETAQTLIKLFKKISRQREVLNKIPDSAFLKFKTNENVSNITLAEFIIFDYLINGNLAFKSTKGIINNMHAIEWNKTIDKISPLLYKNFPVYDVWYSNQRYSQDDHILNQIHMRVYDECLKRYGSIIGVNETSHICYPAKDIQINNDIAIKVINKKLRQVYGQREITLLKALKTWLIKEQKPSNPEFFGTRYFHVIWERICAYLFEDTKDTKTWNDIFLCPEWFYHDTEKNTTSDGFKIDILCEKVKGKLILADAKYYDITKRSGGILSVSDLSKQINYETQLLKSDAYMRLYSGDRNNLYNIFVFPSDHHGSESNKFCEIIFPNLYDRKLWGITIDTLSAFRKYLSNTPLGSSKVSAILSDFN